MQRQSVYFTAPGQVEVLTEPLSEPAAGQVLVQTQLSAISSGSELLIYRGQFPADVPVDETIPALGGEFAYPLKYGYSAVGRVIALGPDVHTSWLERRVFSFQPHTSHFLVSPDELQRIPDELQPEDAVFLPNMETAVNLVMDAAPLIGESVAVFGQGIVGLLVTALLARFPLGSLVALDCFPNRRMAALDLGAHHSLDPEMPGALRRLSDLQPGGADLVVELSGSPVALDQAIAAAGFAGRVVVGSWYGQKLASLNLGGRFHRSRIRLLSSQVSTLAPELSGRWDKARRFGLAWEMLRRLRPSRLVSHRLPLSEAPQAYRLLDLRPGDALQVLLEYSNG